MKYPSSWSKGEALDIRGEDLHELWFISSQENQSDPYLEKVIVQLLDNMHLFETESQTLEENVLSLMDALEQDLDNFEVESSYDVNFQGIPAHKLVYTYTDSTLGSAKTMEIIVVRDNARYVFIFTAQSDQYDSTVSTAEKIFDSIVFIK